MSRDPASHGEISGLVPAAGYDRASWRQSAARRQAADPELFFPIGPAGIAVSEIQRAKAICDSCPVRPPCLTFALVTHGDLGIWGGHDETERRLLHRQQANPEPLPAGEPKASHPGIRCLERSNAAEVGENT